MRKKLALSLLLISIASKSFSFVCSSAPYDQQYYDPDTKAYGTATNTCDCCAAHHNNPTGCTPAALANCTAAPINSFLVMLIIGGVGVGAFMINKNKAKNTEGLFIG